MNCDVPKFRAVERNFRESQWTEKMLGLDLSSWKQP